MQAPSGALEAVCPVLYDKENEYVISYNGGAITENKNNRLLHFEGIHFNLANELCKRGLNYSCLHKRSCVCL